MDTKGLIGWIAVIVGLVLCVLEKYNRSRNILATLVSLVIYFLIQLSINEAPLSCSQALINDNLPEGSTKVIPIIQTVSCVLFSVLYALLLFSESYVTTE